MFNNDQQNYAQVYEYTLAMKTPITAVASSGADEPAA